MLFKYVLEQYKQLNCSKVKIFIKIKRVTILQICNITDVIGKILYIKININFTQTNFYL